MQPPWGDTSLASVGALTIQAWQLDREERRRDREKLKIKLEGGDQQSRADESFKAKKKVFGQTEMSQYRKYRDLDRRTYGGKCSR